MEGQRETLVVVCAMKFWHLTKWKEWEVGRVYETNWDESNYWQHKKRLRFVDGLDRVVQELKYRSELLKEYIFELERLKVCPGCPSRFNAMFLIPVDVDIERFAGVFGMRGYKVVEVEVVDVFGIHRTDPSWLDCNLAEVEVIEAFARSYWRGDKRSELAEVLFRGRFRIVTRPSEVRLL